MKTTPVLLALACLLSACCHVLRAGDEPKKEIVRDWEPIVAKNPPPNRYVTYQEYIAKGPQMKVVAATCFGEADHEEFVAAGALPDGTLVAFGNAYGPAFPGEALAPVIGKGQHRALKPKGLVGKKEQLRPEDPDCAAFLAFYDAKLSKLQKVVRFDWGVAGLATGLVAPDGKALFLAGRCTEAFRALKDQVGALKTLAIGGGAYVYEGVQCAGDVYVLRMAADGSRIEWAWVFEGCGQPPDQLWVDKNGAVYFDAKGLTRISADGETAKQLAKPTRSGTARWHLVDPEDGSAYFGGDRNTHTRREPWRQPYLYKFDAAGQKLWRLWEFTPGDVGADQGGLQSDSAVRAMEVLPDGKLMVAGWSDGGNSVFQRLATDWKKNAPQGGFGMTPWWPKGANSFAHLIVIDPKTQETKSHQWWVGYIPESFQDPGYRNRSNGLSIQTLKVLADGALAVAGNAGTGLLQSPGAFWKDPGAGAKYGGSYVSVFNKERTNLVFSSYLPGCGALHLGATAKGLLVASGTAGKDTAEPPTATPCIKAVQGFKAATDGHLVLLELP